MTLLILSVLFSLSIFGISYSMLDLTGGRSALQRERFHLRLKQLRHSPSAKVRIEKSQTYSDIRPLNELLKKQEFSKRLNHMLRVAGWKLSQGIFLLTILLIGLALYFILKANGLTVLLALGAAFGATILGTFALLNYKYQLYLKKFSLNFSRALQVIRGALGAGVGLGSSFERAALDSPYPVNKEFAQMMDEMKLGKSLTDVLIDLYKRIPTIDVKTFLVGLTVQQESGGNLVELLRNLEDTISARVMLRKELYVLSAQARLSGIIIFLIPIGLAVIVHVINPAYIKILIETDIGKKVLLVTGILQVVGFLWIKKLTSIKIAT